MLKFAYLYFHLLLLLALNWGRRILHRSLLPVGAVSARCSRFQRRILHGETIGRVVGPKIRKFDGDVLGGLWSGFGHDVVERVSR